jgi:1-acyl-sn-glycerol-3-phosphate acyltransferase
MRAPLSSIAAREPGLAEDGLGADTRRPAAGPPAALHRPVRLGAFYVLLALFGLTCLVWSPLAALLHRVLPRRLGEELGQRVIMAGFRAFLGAAQRGGIIRCELAALDALAQSGPLIIAPNHPSLLDVALVISRVPQVACAAKAPIWDNLFLGGAARLAGFVRNDSPVRLVREAVRQTRGGRHFLIFPEGTRSDARPVGPFKGGFALIAKHAGAPVQTVFIETNSRFLGKGWPLFKRPEFPLVYRARLGQRVAVEGDVHKAIDRLERYYRQELGAGDS